MCLNQLKSKISKKEYSDKSNIDASFSLDSQKKTESKLICDLNCIDTNPKQMSPLTLAFIGDAVFELMVREYIATLAPQKIGDLHKKCVSLVNASTQASVAFSLIEHLSPEEVDIFKRGRNAKTAHKPRNKTSEEYHTATGLEALFGYLYIKGDTKRLKSIFSLLKRDYNEHI